MSDCVYERGGSKKYVLTEGFLTHCKCAPKKDIFHKDCTFTKQGLLLIGKGYEWDGPSGPAIDTDNFMDGSLVHDMFYQLLREEVLTPRYVWRLKADNEMFRQCKKDGMSLPRRCWTWLGVRLGGLFAAGYLRW